MSVIEEIKARLDIVSYINQYAPLKKAGRSHKACCPFHSEKTPSFVVSDEYQSWRCFGACAEGGDIFSFAMKYHNWDFKEALQELGKLAGVEVHQRSPEQQQQADHADRLRGLIQTVADAYHAKIYDPNDADAAKALSYAREGRGLTDETIRAFGVGYAPDSFDTVLNYLIDLGHEQQHIIEAGLALRSERSGRVYDRFRDRLMVPIRDEKGRVVGFGGRVLDPEDTPKYMNSPQTLVFDKSGLLFGLDQARQAIRETGTVVIVEGYMDVITAHQAGFRNVVAQMGTAITEDQLRLVAPKHAHRIVLALDSDAAGQNATRRSLEVARETLRSDYTGRLSVDIRVMHIPDAKDPDDLIREEPDRWQYLVDNAMSVTEFVIQMELASLPETPSVPQKEEIARRVVPLLMATENNLIKQENLQLLARRLLIPEGDLLRLAEEVRQEEARRHKQRLRRQQRQQQAPPPAAEGPPPITAYGAPPPPGSEEPPPLDHGAQATARPRRRSVSAYAEAHILNQLIEHPEVYYRINRKLQEAANNNPCLVEDVMASFGDRDFENTGLRQLMNIFLEAHEQDEMDILEYVLAHADEALQSELDLILTNRLERKVQPASTTHRGDLAVVKQNVRFGGALSDPTRDMIAQALRLRCRRINRERHQLQLLQANAEAEGDTDRAETCMQQLDMLATAMHRLETEVNEVARLY